jgi:nicotinamide-nucleotide amidase
VVGVAILFTIWSGLDYLWRFRYLIAPFGMSRSAGRLGPSGGAPEAEEAGDTAGRDLGQLLRKAGLTVSVAESCTGGLVGKVITDQPGSSAYFLGGVIAYADEVKSDQLGVPPALLNRVGAVSAEVAKAMAEGARSRFGTDLAVGVTGIAGPNSDGSDKPVGLTYIAVASLHGTEAREFRFGGDRASNRSQAAVQALQMLAEEARALNRMKSA